MKYCETLVVNHTDDSLLPSSRMDWRDLNLVVSSPDADVDADAQVVFDADAKQEPELEETKHTTDNHTNGDIKGKSRLTNDSAVSLASTSSAYPTHNVCLPRTYAMATHILPPSHAPATSRYAIYQTTNPTVPPAPASILSVARLQRAVVTCAGKDALGALWRERPSRWAVGGVRVRFGTVGKDGGVLGDVQGAGRLDEAACVQEGETERGRGAMPGIWFCGSYAAPGIPLLEGCVVSAKNVVEQGVWASEGVDVARAPVLW